MSKKCCIKNKLKLKKLISFSFSMKNKVFKI